MKKSTILITILLVILTIGAVSASDDNQTSHDMAASEDLDVESGPVGEIDDSPGEILKESDDEMLLSDSEGTFSELSDLINGSEAGSTIILAKDYSYDENISSEGISIDKAITIDGDNHVLDAKSSSRIFLITSYDVTLKNIIFKYAQSSQRGGAIKFGPYPMVLNKSACAINCSFIGCSATHGGAIDVGSSFGDGFIAYNCSFSRCSATKAGGAIFDVAAYGCNFSRCTSIDNGGAMYGKNATYCVFDKCQVTGDGYGGAISNGFAVNCNFTGNTVKQCGGAITSTSAVNCIFIGNGAGYDGGAMYGSKATGCTFIGNSAGVSGGALSGNAANCIFENNTAWGDGGAIITDGNVLNCSFKGCHATTGDGGAIFGGTVVDCSFEDCSADVKGGAMYGCLAKNCTFKNCTPQNMYNMDSNLTINVKNINHGETAIVNITIDEAATGNITVSVDGESIAAEFLNGYASIPLSNLSDGPHTIKAVYAGDGIFKSTNKQKSFRVRIDPKFKINLTDIDDSHALLTMIIGALENDTEAERIFYVTITVYAGNIEKSVVQRTFSFKKGKSNLTLDNLTAGDNISVKFADSNYITYTESVIFQQDIPPAPAVYPVKVIASDLNMIYSSASKFKVTVYGSDGKPASGASVVIKVAGKNVATVKTDSNGVATYKPTQTPGSYKISAIALGMTITKKLTVNHAVTLKKVTVKKSAKKLVLQATLSKVDGKYLKGKKITFKFNGKSYKAKTNAKGVAKYTIKSSVLKKLKVGKKVTYQATYNKDTVKKTVKIKK